MTEGTHQNERVEPTERFGFRLCINADDYGLSSGVDRGILELADEGVVTSVSALPHGPAFQQDAAALRCRPQLSVGLHASLGPAGGMADRGHLWSAVTARAGLAMTQIFRSQLDSLEEAIERSVTHVDSHLHIHALPGIRAALQRLCEERSLPLRRPREIAPSPSLKARLLRAAFADDNSGCAFFGIDLMRRIERGRIEQTFSHIQRLGFSSAVWMVHPGHVSTDHPEWDDYRSAREQELASLRRLQPWLHEVVDLVSRAELTA